MLQKLLGGIIKPLADAGSRIAEAKFNKDKTVVNAKKDTTLANIKRREKQAELELRRDELAVKQEENEAEQDHQRRMFLATSEAAMDMENTKQNRKSYRDEYLMVLLFCWLEELLVLAIVNPFLDTPLKPMILSSLDKIPLNFVHYVDAKGYIIPWTAADATIVMSMAAFMVIYGLKGMVSQFINSFGKAAGGIKGKLVGKKDASPPALRSGGTNSKQDEPEEDEDEILSAKREDERNGGQR